MGNSHQVAHVSPFGLLTSIFFGSIALLSIWPGAVEADLTFLLVAALFVVWLTWAAVRTGRRGLQGQPWPWTGTALLLAAFAALWFDVPRRLLFAVSRSSFEAVAKGPGPSESRAWRDAQYATVPLPSGALGIYAVMDARRDQRGGVYFRTSTSMDMIDQMSWGFAWHPNQEGSPYGRARYRLRPLGGGWYSFRASDDY